MPWEKGKSGNPRGRPKQENSLTGWLRRLLAEEGGDGKTHKELVAQALIEAAEAGNIPAIREIYERIDGKVAVEVRLDFQAEVDRIARELNLDPAEVMREAEAILGKRNAI